MRRLATTLLASILSAGCGHTHHTDAADPKRPNEPVGAHAYGPRRPAGARTPPAKAAPDAVPVAASADALLEAGAEQKLRDKLVAGGFLAKDARDADGPTREALRRFQREHDLPATGVPDHETVRRLGLDPNQLFRSGQR